MESSCCLLLTITLIISSSSSKHCCLYELLFDLRTNNIQPPADLQLCFKEQAAFQALEHVRKFSSSSSLLVLKCLSLNIFLAYVPSVAAPRGVYRSSYVRPRTGYGYRPALPRPVVPAGRGPGGAGLLAAILGPIGGLTGCLCCLNTIGVWGLFITAIPLTVFISKFPSLSL